MIDRRQLVLAVAGLLSACRGQTSTEAPVVPIRNMYDQPRYETQEASRFFQDGRSMRTPVEGTVAREAEVDVTVAEGRTLDNAAWLLELPGEVVERNGGMPSFVHRGQERYDVYCAPCHGVAGDGQGLVSARAGARGFSALAAPSLQDERLRHIPDGQLFGTITNGIRNMPMYRHNIPMDDRWAIVAYVRALQISGASMQTAMNDAEERTP